MTGTTSSSHTANSATTTPNATGRTMPGGSNPRSRTDTVNAPNPVTLLIDETRNTTPIRHLIPTARYSTLNSFASPTGEQRPGGRCSPAAINGSHHGHLMQLHA
jgi:hypothetical protein